MADSALPRTRDTSGTLDNVDTRTTTTTGDHRQVVVVGDPDTDAAVAEVQNAAPGVSDYGVAVRPIGGAAGTPAGSVLSVQGVVSGTNLPVALGAALPAGTANIGDVDVASVPAITKGTQGSTGLTTQDLKDAGRNPTAYVSTAVVGSSTESLLSLTGTKSGATVTATTTPAVVTAGKTLRLTRFAASYIATATSGYGVYKLRYNPVGVVAVTSPILVTIIVGAGTPATANSTGYASADLPDGVEIPAGAGIGITAQTFSATTPTSTGLVHASVLGFEY